jgi:hypothetical protein
MFVLGPECQRLTSLDPSVDGVIEAPTRRRSRDR